MTDFEFTRPLRLDTLGEEPRAIDVAADPVERAALAARFGWLGLDRLRARATVRRVGDAVDVEGVLEAEVVQACVVTAEPLPRSVTEPFALRFLPEASLAQGEEIELDEGALDVIGYAGGAVDLGEAVAQGLALALDPFPRAPGADAALREAGVVSEEEAGPFGALKALKDRLG